MIVREKELKHRMGLHVFGLSSASHWLAWSLTGAVYSSVSTVSLLFFTHIFRFDCFLNAPLWLMFAFFFSVSYSMVMLAFLISTVVSTETVANTMAYSFVLLSVLMQVIFSNTVVLYAMFYMDNLETWVIIVRSIFNMIPSFNFSRLFGQIVRITGSSFDGGEMKWNSGRRFLYKDLFINTEGTLVMGDTYTVPSPYESFKTIVMTIIVFWLLTWYFDHVI